MMGERGRGKRRTSVIFKRERQAERKTWLKGANKKVPEAEGKTSTLNRIEKKKGKVEEPFAAPGPRKR